MLFLSVHSGLAIEHLQLEVLTIIRLEDEGIYLVGLEYMNGPAVKIYAMSIIEEDLWM